MQNPSQKFRQSSIVFEKPGILPGKLKTFNELQLPQTLIIFVEILHAFPTCQYLQIGVWDFFKFCLELELFANIKKYLVSTHSQKPGLPIT